MIRSLLSLLALVTLPADEPTTSMTFELDIQPILVSTGCSTGACHGKQGGQNGFQLSLLCFDADFDYLAITQESRGRRIFPAAPDRSLFLQKATAQIPHGGGKRFEPDSPEYATLLEWIRRGMPRSTPKDPVLERITVNPVEKVMSNNTSLQLKVTAHYSDKATRDVTHVSTFQSNESAIAGVDRDGVIKAGPITGEAAIMSRYMDKIVTTNILIPLPGDVPAVLYTNLPRFNFIDQLVWEKLERLKLTPSQPADDSTFLRRAYLDIIGRVPTPDETRAFLSDGDSKKRPTLIDKLLRRSEYADHWANKWADLLRPNPYRVGIKAVLSFDTWIRDAFRKNIPYDEFVSNLLTAQGSTWRNGAATLFRDRRAPDELATMVSQLFLGVRLECAKCHHHPFEIWGQDDFYSFAAFFSRVGRKGSGLSPPISGGEEIIFTASSGSVSHPRTGQVMPARTLTGDTPANDPDTDPREQLTAWMTSDTNPYFSLVITNRVWADLMGRGLVEPVDDIRGTNPPSNKKLLEALAKDFRESGYDLKALIRRITTSYVYGMDSQPSERNLVDTRNYSRFYRQRLRAEVLLDAYCDITGVPESFDAMPIGSQAKQIWTHRVSSIFLDTFGRPDMNQDPPCERTTDTAVVQALHLMNSPVLHGKVTNDSGRAAELAKSSKTEQEISEELYLLIYSRFPTDDEMKVATKVLKDSKRRQAVEDLMWALMNTPEFVFKD